MPALNFKKQFAPKVESGEKKTTIRAKRKDGRNPRPGQTLYLYTGMRSKGCRKLKEAVCANVSEIVIDPHRGINLRGDWLDYSQTMSIVRGDGFELWTDFLAFFRKEHELPFWGLLIEW